VSCHGKKFAVIKRLYAVGWHLGCKRGRGGTTQLDRPIFFAGRETGCRASVDKIYAQPGGSREAIFFFECIFRNIVNASVDSKL